MVKIITLNILSSTISAFLNYICPYKVRYEYIISSLIIHNADIVCLNEVDKSFYLFLINSEIKNLYPYFSKKIDDFKSSHGVLIISKEKFEVVKSNERNDYAIFESENNKFLVVSSHLLAYEQNYLMRQKQLMEIITEAKQFISNHNIIILGDFNFHYIKENEFIYENDFLDIWDLFHHSESGFTLDTSVNTMINKFLPFDNRRFRLDRIIVDKSTENIQFKAIDIIFNKKIESTTIFPSDHFGLVAEFNIKDKVKYVYNNLQLEVSEFKHKYRSIRTIVMLRLAALLVMISITYLIFKLINV